MYDNTIQQALGDISDAYLESAMDVYECKRKARKRWHRVVACAAVLALLLGAMFFWPVEENYVTGPGMITVRAHAVDEDVNETIKSVVLEEGVVFTPEYIYRTDTSYRERFPFLFQVEHELYSPDEMILEVTTNAGIFYKYSPGDITMVGKTPIEQLLYHNYGQHFTVNADKALYWKPDGFDYDYLQEQFAKGNTDISQALKEFGFSSNPAYFDVIIRTNDYIIGYFVIEVKMSPMEISTYAHRLSFEMVTLVNFPMVDGKHQNVPLNYVQTQIQKIHSEREARL